MNKEIFVILLTPLILLGCSTSYQEYSTSPFTFMGHQGYAEYQIDENTYSISFQGNGFTSGVRTYRYALQRAAEVAAQNGCRYFLVLNGRDQTQMNTQTTVYNDGIHQHITTHTEELPATTLYIRIYKNRPNAEAYDAYDILKTTNKKN